MGGLGNAEILVTGTGEKVLSLFLCAPKLGSRVRESWPSGLKS